MNAPLTVLTLYRYVLCGIVLSELLAPQQHKKLFIGVKTNIVSAHKRNDMADLLSAFLFVSCPYVLNAQRLGERFFKLGVVSYDSHGSTST